LKLDKGVVVVIQRISKSTKKNKESTGDQSTGDQSTGDQIFGDKKDGGKDNKKKGEKMIAIFIKNNGII
jgi:hypothetical protein